MCSHCTEETIRKRKEFWTLLLFKASASGWICHNTAPCCGCLHVPTSSVISISSSRWMFVWCPFDAFFAIFCYTLPTPAYALNLNEVGTQLCSALKLAMMESCEVKDFTDPEKPDYIQSFMFCSNLGLINTVSSVRSKPSFEVLKLASLRSSWGVLVKRRKFSKATLILRLTAMQATWGSLLGLLPEGGTCTVHGQRQKDKTSRSFV